ncbi:MAG: hypothetical protein LZF86_190322 [Nitrospira sp.]|nr:MAG: hypothetical protein LZF86_190322 [Nitrospira sp.]
MTIIPKETTRRSNPREWAERNIVIKGSIPERLIEKDTEKPRQPSESLSLLSSHMDFPLYFRIS